MRATDVRFKTMDDMGVDMQLVCPAPPQIYYTVPLEIGVQANHIINDGIAEYVGKHPDRLVALGGVPMQDGNEAAKELERCMKVLKFKGVEVLTNVGGKELSDPAFAPFWKKAEELGALVLIHPNGFTHAERFTRFYFNNVIGNPLETTVALHYLIFDGVLERHPNLKILAVHGGGYLGGYSGRIDHAWGARSDSHASLPKPPTHYLKKVFFDTVVFTPIQLEALVKTFGADHVVLGSDYPFDMADFDPIEHVVSTGFDASTTAAIVGGNAKRISGALSVEKIDQRGLGDHRLGGAVAPRVGAFLVGLRRLQIGAEMAGALDDAAADGQPLRLEFEKRRLDLVRRDRVRKGGRVLAGLRHAGADMRSRHERGVADDRDAAERHARGFQVVDRLQHRLVHQPRDDAKLRRHQPLGRGAHRGDMFLPDQRRRDR